MNEEPKFCSFCWLFIHCYPGFKDIPPKDGLVYREHLRREHAWKPEIKV